MILVTGGAGFIGSHTVQALQDQGEECVLVQRRPTNLPNTETADITDLPALLEVGTRHKITGIVHLAGSMPWPPTRDDPIEATRTALNGLLNVLQAAQTWAVPRVGVASTIGVYSGLTTEGPLHEDMPLPMTAPHLIPTFKKIGELLTGHLTNTTNIEIVNYRIAAIWGPRDPHGPLFFAAPELVNAAAQGTKPDLSPLPGPAYAEDAIDLCYVKDCARAIALLQLAEHLNHHTYNIASGRATTNAEIISAIKNLVPEAQVDLPTGRPGPQSYLDITRLQKDTGYHPAYNTDQAVADYLAWLT